jgi:hypothetical protein
MITSPAIVGDATARAESATLHRTTEGNDGTGCSCGGGNDGTGWTGGDGNGCTGCNCWEGIASEAKMIESVIRRSVTTSIIVAPLIS